MDIYSATIGELIVIEAFVFYLWLQILIRFVADKDKSLEGRKVLLTSIGLLLNAGAIIGIMSYRVYELITDNWPFVWGIVIFYMMLAVGNIMFIVSASIGSNFRLLKAFCSVTLIWAIICVYLVVS